MAEERGAGAAQAAAAQESDLPTSSRVVDVDVDELELCPEYQLREKLETWKVEEYGAVFERLPPVLVGKVDGHLYLLDGWHRVAAARSVGREKVAALIIETDAATAFSLAIRGNAMHGLPLRTKEKKAAARGMLVRFPERSDRWIAEDSGLSHPTVTGLRGELEAGGKICHLGYSVGQDGKRYPCDCARCRTEPKEFTAKDASRTEGCRTEGSDRNEFRTSAEEPKGFTVGDAEERKESTTKDAKEFEQFSATSGEQSGLPAPYRPEIDHRSAIRQVVETVTVLEGDARRMAEYGILPVQLVITSPPYNVGVRYGRYADNLPDEDYGNLLLDTWRACHAVMAEGARIAVIVPFGVGRDPWRPLAARVAEQLRQAGFSLRGQIVWDKGTSGGRTTWGSFRLPTNPSLRDTTEAIVVAHKGESRLPLPAKAALHDSEWTYTSFLSDQALFMELALDHWTVPPESATRVGHQAPFPVAVAERLIRFYAYPGAHVLDPFAGSGTTGVAALRLGCRATLVDIDGEYCRLAAGRCRREAQPSTNSEQRIRRPGGRTE